MEAKVKVRRVKPAKVKKNSFLNLILYLALFATNQLKCGKDDKKYFLLYFRYIPSYLPRKVLTTR